MSKSFEHLTRPSEFTEDEPVEFAAVEKGLLPGPIEGKYRVCIPERLWVRLLSYGTAYGLHFQQVIEPIIDTVLNSQQSESFADELDFLSTVTNDQAFLEALRVIRTEVGKVVNRQDMRLVVSPP